MLSYPVESKISYSSTVYISKPCCAIASLSPNSLAPTEIDFVAVVPGENIEKN